MAEAASESGESASFLDRASTSQFEQTSMEDQQLQDLSPTTTADDVAAFARRHGLLHRLNVLEKASLIISGELLSDIPHLTEHEIRALHQETERKWRQPRMLYFTIIVCSLAAIEQGWAQTGMNGANLYFPKALGIGSNSPKDNLIVGFINSGIYLSAGILGAWLSEPINNCLGRRGAIFIGATLCLFGNIGSALSQTWPVLLLFRLVLGSGMAINASTVSVWAGECSPAAIRGGLAVSWQMATAFGIFLSFGANVGVYNYGSNTWRLQLAAPFIPTIPLLIMLYICPESPAWYLKHGGRYDLAYQALQRLRNTELQAAKELYATYLQRRARSVGVDLHPSYPRQIFELFTIPRIRRATAASYVVMLSQQLCGINIISFYSSTIFSDAGFSDFGALMASTIFGFVNFVGAWPAVYSMDSFGRRSLLLLTLPFMALTMFAAALSFKIPAESPAHFGLLCMLIYLFCAIYSPGMGPVPSTYSAEVFPLSHREVGMSLAVATANCWAAVLSLTFPRILTALGSDGAFELYAVLNVVAVVLIFLFVPETKLRTLDELDEVFSVPSSTFIRYQTMEYLPWMIRRYLMGQNDAELKPLALSGEYRALEQEEDDN